MTDRLSNYKFRCLCRECGGEFGAQRSHAAFCTTACRKVWHNRRQKRGAELYDVVMNWRFGHVDNRAEGKGARAKADAAAQKLHGCDVRTLLCSIASGFRAADEASRDGRPSHMSIRELTEALGRLAACDDGR